MIPKLNLLSALAAVLFFFLPWTSIECHGRQMATQTGVQVMTGGVSTKKNEQFSADVNARAQGDSSLGRSYLAIVALLCAVSAVVTGLAVVITGHQHAAGGPAILCSCALVCLIAQGTWGFPAKHKLMESMAQSNPDPGPGGENELGHAVAEEIAEMIHVRPLPGFYAELAALGIPTLILLNGLLDRLRAASEKRA